MKNHIASLIAVLLLTGCAQLPPVTTNDNTIPLFQASFESLNAKIPEAEKNYQKNVAEKSVTSKESAIQFPGGSKKQMSMLYTLQEASGYTREGKIVSGYILTWSSSSPDHVYSPALADEINKYMIEQFSEVTKPVLVEGITYK